MGNSKKKSTSMGPLSWRDLQKANAEGFQETRTMTPDEFLVSVGLPTRAGLSQTALLPKVNVSGYDAQSDILQNALKEGKDDYWGDSFFDDDIAVGNNQISSLSDTRAENQPWYSKIINGIGKMGVTILTTAAETVGLFTGAIKGAMDATFNKEEKGGWGEIFLKNLWDNPVSEALQSVNDFAEKWMPNYYTQDEKENPWSHLFNANWIGDKLIKNIGFMIGAYYGGVPVSKMVGGVGVKAAKAAHSAYEAEKIGMAARASKISSGFGDDVIKEANALGDEVYGLGKKEAASIASKYGEEAQKLHRALSKEGLTASERAAQEVAGMDRVRRIAQTTRATTQALGTFVSAVNEGAIEAINNSRDWERSMQQEENDRYEARLQELKEMGLDDDAHLIAEREEHDARLAEIAKGRATMGNADLLLNLPVLWLSNAYQLGRLYSRGFGSVKRGVGGIDKWSAMKKNAKNLDKLGKSRRGISNLSGKAGTLATKKSKVKGMLSSFYKVNTEGVEEFLQRAASDGSGETVKESIERYFNSPKDEEAKADFFDFVEGFGKAAAKNLGDPNAWEEYFIGAFSACFGMPVFGSQTRNAQVGKGKKVGLAGGLYGHYQDYKEEMAREKEIADYINKRVNDPNSKFRPLYDALIRNGHLDKLISGTLSEEDKALYKDLEWEKLFNDINAFASAGRISELKELIGYNKELSDKELEDIIKNTTKTVTAAEQRKRDKDSLAHLETIYAALNEEEKKDEDAIEMQKEIDTLKDRIEKDASGELKYKDKREGPFVDVNGDMNVTDPAKMRKILEKNRMYLLNSIDDYLKARNDIDIETDGRLDDNDISTLTFLKSKVLHKERRMSDMAYDLASNLGLVQEEQEAWKEKIVEQRESTETELENAKAELAKAKEEKKSKSEISALEGKVTEKEKSFKQAKKAENDIERVISILDYLTKMREMTADEKKGYKKGYGKKVGERTTSAEEMEMLLLLPDNFSTLAEIIDNTPSEKLDDNARDKLLSEAFDLYTAALEKAKYNHELRKMIKDPSLINEAKQKEEDKISQKEREEQEATLVSQIQSIESLEDLDALMRESLGVSREIATNAFNKAVKDAKGDRKTFLQEYKRATEFRDQILDLLEKEKEEEVKIEAIKAVLSAFDRALVTNGSSMYKDFMNNLSNIISTLKGLNAQGVKSATAIENALKKLDSAYKSVNNHTPKNKSKSGTESAEEKRKRLQSMGQAASREGEEKGKGTDKGKTEGKDTATEETIEDRDSLMDDIAASIRKSLVNSKWKISSTTPHSILTLPDELREKVRKFNEEHKDDADSLIADTDIQQIVQEIVDDYIENSQIKVGQESQDEAEAAEMAENSQTSDAMKRQRRANFISDRVSKYRYQWAGPVVMNDPNTPQLKAIQALLEKYKAYDFVDHNLLAYYIAATGNSMVKVLKSTDDTVDGNGQNESTLFLAIEWNPNKEDTKSAILKQAYNKKGKKSRIVDDNTNIVTVNGKQYQIIGALSYDKDADTQVKDAFVSLQGAVNDEVNPKKEEARSRGDEFVVSSTELEIGQLFTGRISEDDKHNNAEDVFGDFEYEIKYGGTCFGVVVNGDTKVGRNSAGVLQSPNPRWAEKNNGAIVMFVPRPDGNLYPIRMSRKEVSNSHIEFIKQVYNKTQSNSYIEGILKHLTILLDPNKPWEDRMQAKSLLSRYFVFANSPIYFSDVNVKITLDNDAISISTQDDVAMEDRVMQFFEALRDHSVLFSIPSPSIEEVNPWDTIQAGIFEVGMASPFNVNANFTVVAKDGKGNPVNVNASDIALGGLGNKGAHMRGERVTINLGSGERVYIITEDGTVIDAEDGNPLSAENQELVHLANKADKNMLPSCKHTLIPMLCPAYKTQKTKDFVINSVAGYDKVFVFKDNDGEQWVYDARLANHHQRLYKLDSARGKALQKDIQTAIQDFATKNIKKIAQMEKEISPEAKPFIDRMNASNNREEVDAIFKEGLAANIPEKELFPTYSRRQAEIGREKKAKEKKAAELDKHVSAAVDYLVNHFNGSIDDLARKLGVGEETLQEVLSELKKQYGMEVDTANRTYNMPSDWLSKKIKQGMSGMADDDSPMVQQIKKSNRDWMQRRDVQDSLQEEILRWHKETVGSPIYTKRGLKFDAFLTWLQEQYKNNVNISRRLSSIASRNSEDFKALFQELLQREVDRALREAEQELSGKGTKGTVVGLSSIADEDSGEDDNTTKPGTFVSQAQDETKGRTTPSGGKLTGRKITDLSTTEGGLMGTLAELYGKPNRGNKNLAEKIFNAVQAAEVKGCVWRPEHYEEVNAKLKEIVRTTDKVTKKTCRDNLLEYLNCAKG